MSITWSDPIEKLIKRVGEQSMCYNILHRRSQSYYAYYNHFVAIPSIALSSITAAITFALGNQETGFSSILLGSLNVITAFIGTLGSYFRFAALAEQHRITAIQYNKIYQTISQQLALNRELREPAQRILDMIRDAIDRLQEIAPEIPQYVINGFKTDYKQYTNVSRPTITNGLETIEVNTEPPPPPRSPIASVVLEPPTEPPPSALPIPKATPKPWRG